MVDEVTKKTRSGRYSHPEDESGSSKWRSLGTKTQGRVYDVNSSMFVFISCCLACGISIGTSQPGGGTCTDDPSVQVVLSYRWS